MMLHGKLFSYIYRCPVHTIVSKPAKLKASASVVFFTLAKATDNHWIAMALVLFALGTAFIASARRG